MVWIPVKHLLRVVQCQLRKAACALMRLVLLRFDADYSGGPAFSGGQHVFRCIGRALAEAGHDVHVLRAAERTAVLCEAATAGALAALQQSVDSSNVVIWRAADGVTHHVALTHTTQSSSPEYGSCGGREKAPQRNTCGSSAAAEDAAAATAAAAQHQPDVTHSSLRCKTSAIMPQHAASLLDELRVLLHSSSSSNDTPAWALLDADSAHVPLAPGAPPLLEAADAAVGASRLLLLVQNTHFLPFGPAGCTARRPASLAAWSRAAGAVCVSRYVASYVLRHMLPLGMHPARLWMLHPAAVGAFGRGPFPDLGMTQLASGAVPWPRAVVADADSNVVAPSPPPSPPPVVGCLKLSEDKGSPLFLGLAALLPELPFVGVCADERAAAAAAVLKNVQLLAPAADVGSPLAQMTVLLVPSLWDEAFGMVAFAGALRGLPVLVSSVGGLPEAAAGAPAATLPVSRIRLRRRRCSGSDTAHCGAPVWRAREVPVTQPLGVWEASLRRLLGDAAGYAAAGGAARAAALTLLRAERGMMRAFEGWLLRLAVDVVGRHSDDGLAVGQPS